MKERLNSFIHSRLFIAILILLLICTTLLVGTYAWFTWGSTDNTKLVMSIGKMADVTFTSGNDIDGELNPVYDYKDGLSTRFSINNRDTSGTIVGYNVYLNITTIASELISEDVKWVLTRDNKVINEGNFSTASDGITITLDSGNLSTGTTFYAFYLYIDGNVENDPSMMGKTITGNIMVEANNGVNLLNHITSLYTNADKTVVTNNGINYNYASSVRLMNDRLGDSNIDADSGNIRYYGADDENLNNYIYFNCSDYSNQSSSTCETWRIIGIVDGKVKLTRSESIGDYAWNNDGTNNWETATLNTYLNGVYYSSLSIETQGLISNSTYYLGSVSLEEVYSNQMYKYERTNEEGTTIYSGNPFTVETNIGIMYASDYGYATDFNECYSNLYLYENEECYSNDWLYNNEVRWLINPSTDESTYVWTDNGSPFFAVYEVTDEYGVRPVLYLDSEALVNKGEGSSGNPYQIYVAPKDASVAFEYITSLYNDADKTETTKDSVVYNFASSVSLMNDRLGGTTDDYDGGNIRYYGVSPDNYIYFNCSDYSNQSSDTCEVWKIIGVFDNKLKIIRGESLGLYSWDSNNSGSNGWNGASLNSLLNDDYYNDSSENYSGLDSVGLKNDETRELIQQETWYLGGRGSTTGGTATQFYYAERDLEYSSTWDGMIALMYPSDYLYSFGTGYSSYLRSENGYGTCYADDYECNNYTIWTITQASDSAGNIFGATSSYVDTVDDSDSGLWAHEGAGVFPTLYLKSDLQFNGYGDGSSDNPYQLLVS